jgi:VanZ family protein
LNSPRLLPSKETRSLHWFRWLLAFAWAALIYSLSTESFGTSFTAMVVGEILRVLHLSVSTHTFDIFHYLLRKSAHCTEYAIFSIFLYHCFLNSNQTEWRAKAAGWAVLVAGLYSLTDEFHQAFVPGRTASLIDSGIDTTGAILGTLLILLWAHIFHPKLSHAGRGISSVGRSE